MLVLWDECGVAFPTPRPLGGGKQNRLPACTIFSLWLYILFLPNMLLWRYIFRQAGAQLRAGAGRGHFFWGLDFGLWNLDFGFWIGEMPKTEFSLLTFLWNWGTPMLFFTQTFFFDFGLLSVDCGLGIGSQKRKFCFLWWEKIKKTPCTCAQGVFKFTNSVRFLRRT